MGFFKKLYTHKKIKKRMRENPGALRDPVKIFSLLKEPFDVWFWAMNMVELVDIDTDSRPKEEGPRTPFEVIRNGEGNVYEIIDTMAYILHHSGWAAVTVYGAKSVNEIFDKPEQVFILVNYLGIYYTLDNEYTWIGRNISLAFQKGFNYVAMDWTGERNLFAIMPRNDVPYRVMEDFDPHRDMP